VIAGCAAVALLGVSLEAAQAGGEGGKILYLLATSPGTEEKLPVNVYRVNASQPSIPSLVTTMTESVDRVLIDYEHRRLVLAYPAIAPANFAVVGMDSPSAVRTLRIPYDPTDLLPAGVYLLDVPQGREYIAMSLGRSWREPRVPRRQLTAAALDGSTGEPVDLPMDALRFVRESGRVGGGIPGQTLLGVRGNPLHVLVAEPKGWSLGLPRPSYFRTDPSTEQYSLAAKNDSVTALSGINDEIEVLVQGSQDWQRVSLPFRSTRIRAFGPWIAAIGEEVGWIGEEGIRGGLITIRESDRDRLLELKGQSPGREKRLSEPIGAKSTVDDLFGGIEAVYPGELLIYNVMSHVKLRISTGQGDSEVLLVADQAVFYRVNDEIYRAAILDGALGNPVRLTAGGDTFQVHWAFLGK
jgi:hypothetical protein